VHPCTLLRVRIRVRSGLPPGRRAWALGTCWHVRHRIAMSPGCGAGRDVWAGPRSQRGARFAAQVARLLEGMTPGAVRLDLQTSDYGRLSTEWAAKMGGQARPPARTGSR
jgi:hypothetical protein